MQSIAYHTTSHTAASSLAAGGDTITLSGGGLLAVAVVLLLLVAAGRRRDVVMPRQGGGCIAALCKGIGRLLLWVLVRVLSGRELFGGPKSDATAWRAGTRTTRRRPVVELGSIGTTRAIDLNKKRQRLPRAGKPVRATVRALTPVLRPAGATLAAWGRWPYAARSAARVVLLALVLGLWLPSWRPLTLLALLGLLLAVVLVVVTGPGGLGWWRPRTPGDDEIYGPPLWTILRQDLQLPEEEPAEAWLHLAPDLAAAGAKVTVRLPWEIRGSDTQRHQLNELINSRLPGEWVGRWEQKGEQHYAQWTHKPEPKPKPQPPDRVDFFSPDIQAAIEACAPDELVVGVDPYGQIIRKKLSGETAHWALSIGSGGGKSAFLQMLMAQLARKQATMPVVDVKMASLACYTGIDGIHIYADPSNIGDMRKAIRWVAAEVEARGYVKKKNPKRVFLPLVLFLEEGNEFGDASKEWWSDNKGDEKGADPIWRDIASIMRLGRHVNAHIIAVFQDLDERQVGNRGIRNLFRLIFMGNFKPQQWTKIVATRPVPSSISKAGRIMVIDSDEPYWMQSPYGEEDAFRNYVIEQRRATGYSPEADLYGKPPEHSPEVVPALLEGHPSLSRDTDREGANRPSDGGSESVVPGQHVTGAEGVTALQTGRDRLHLIRGGGQNDATTSRRHDATLARAEEFLPLAEISRRLEMKGMEIKPDTMRQHKRRDSNFPAGKVVDGKELYTETSIRAYYTEREKKA